MRPGMMCLTTMKAMSEEQDEARDDVFNDDERDHIEELQEHMAKISRQLMNKVGGVFTSFDD
eukprot:6528022-Karenia_brevis.AAC.1